MKTIALLAAGAAMALAQQVSDLPPCGQTCVNNMINIATSDFGCAQGDTACYCKNVDFGYGVRDCSNESCSASDAAKVISYGTNYCQQAGSAASGSSTTVSNSALSVLSSAAATASGASGTGSSGTEASATGTGASQGGSAASSTPFSTKTEIATVSASDTTYVTTTGLSTLYTAVGGAAANATESAGSAASSASESAGSAASSASESASSAAGSAESSASAAASSGASAASSAASSARSGASSALSSATSEGAAAPMKTAGPMLGAAGMALLLAL